VSQLLQFHDRESAHPDGHSANTTPATRRADDLYFQLN